MTLYVYRVMEAGKPNGHYGLVYASSNYDLYWGIDEDVDPHSVEVATLGPGLVLKWRAEEYEIDGSDFLRVAQDEPSVEFGEKPAALWDNEHLSWVKIDWSTTKVCE